MAEIWGAVAIGAGVLGGAILSSNAAGNAADAQSAAAAASSDTQLQASRESIAEQRRQYDQNRTDLQPYRDAGASVLPELTTGTQAGGEFNRSFTMADFQQDPGYQFRMDQGQQALERSAAARGGLLSGGTAKALSRYGQDYASGEYQNAYNRYNNDVNSRFGRLSAVAGIGTGATNTGVQAGNQTASNISNTQTATGAAIGANQLASGNAQAAGYVGQANAINNGISTLGSFYLQNQYSRGV